MTTHPRFCNAHVRQDVFTLGQWTIITKKGIIMQSRCTCERPKPSQQGGKKQEAEEESNSGPANFCDICRYHRLLPHLHAMPDMLFINNMFKLEHSSGVGIQFNPLDALRLVEETSDPLKVAVADGWQSARAECPFAKHISRPFDWTFTTCYKGTLLPSGKNHQQFDGVSMEGTHPAAHNVAPRYLECAGKDSSVVSFRKQDEDEPTTSLSTSSHDRPSETSKEGIAFRVEATDERIDVNKLKVREEILFYDDITLYEDELADHGTAQYSVKVRVMPNSLFILARYYLRIDGVMARINDTRIYHELKHNYLLREYTNREGKLTSCSLPIITVLNPSELMNHLPLIDERYEKLTLPEAEDAR